MSTEPPDSDAEIPKTSPKFYFFFAVALIVFAWIWWGIENFTDFRLTERRFDAKEEPLPILFPLIAMPVVIIGALFYWRRSEDIAKNGILVNAVIESFGLAFRGQQRINLTYTVNSETYSQAISMTTLEAEEKSEGDTMQIVADKRNPKRIHIPIVRKKDA